MNFLYPGFLFALFAVAIPLIIHLFHFRKYKKIDFSNVAFLSAIQEQRSSKEKLKNWLILICRMLVVTFLVLAFAQPYWSAESSNLDSGSRNVRIYIDNSYSMDAVNKEGSLLDEAKRHAKEIVRGFSPNDRFQLLTNDFEGKHQRLMSAEDILQAIDQVRISAASRTLQQVIYRQEAVFKGVGNRYSYVLSDFQKGFLGKGGLQIDPHTQVFLIQLAASNLPNVTVDSLWLLSPVHQEDATETLVVRLKNYGDETAKNIPLYLTVNKVQKAIRHLTVAGGETLQDTLSFGGLKAGWQNGVVQIKDFPLTFDDQMYFSFNVGVHQNVLSINGTKVNRYIHALFSSDAHFNLHEMLEDNIQYAGWTNYNLIVLNGLTQLSSGLSTALRAFVVAGGTVVIFPNMEVDIPAYGRFLGALGLPPVYERDTVPVKANRIELQSPLFKDVFEQLPLQETSRQSPRQQTPQLPARQQRSPQQQPQQIDLPQVNRYFIWNTPGNIPKEDLLALPGDRPFFVRYPQQKGQFFVSASGLEPKDGNLSVHPLFVPLLYKIAFSAMPGQRAYYIAAQDQRIEMGGLPVGAGKTLKLKADGLEILPELRQEGGLTWVYLADQVKTPGFYTLTAADSLMALLAFNDKRSESDMHYDTTSELRKIATAGKVSVIRANATPLLTRIMGKNKGMELWKLCLILALVFIAAEIGFIRFYHIK